MPHKRRCCLHTIAPVLDHSMRFTPSNKKMVLDFLISTFLLGSSDWEADFSQLKTTMTFPNGLFDPNVQARLTMSLTKAQNTAYHDFKQRLHSLDRRKIALEKSKPKVDLFHVPKLIPGCTICSTVQIQTSNAQRLSSNFWCSALKLQGKTCQLCGKERLIQRRCLCFLFKKSFLDSCSMLNNFDKRFDFHMCIMISLAKAMQNFISKI